MAFRGVTADLPLGVDGLTGTHNHATARASQLLRANNVTYEDGTLRKEGGSTKYNSSAITGAPAIVGGWDWFPAEGVQRMVVLCDDGKLYKDTGDGSFSVTLKTGLTVSNVVPVFVEGGQEAGASDRKLFVFTGKNDVQVLTADGATTSTIATPPSDWSGIGQPTTGAIHEGRLWGFKGHIAYYSTPDDHEDFQGSGSGSLLIYPGEGEKIIWSTAFGPYLVVVKFPRGIYLIDTSSVTVSNWRVNRITREIGMISPLAGVVVDSDILIMDLTGDLYALSSLSEQSDVRSRNLGQIADLQPYMRSNTNAAQYGKVQAVYYAAKRRAEFAIAGSGSSVNNTRLVVDFNRPDLPRFRHSDYVTCEALWLRKDANSIPRPVGGDDAGFVRLLDRETRAHDDAGYAGEAQTTYTDFGYLDMSMATKRKNAAFLELLYEPKGAWDLSVQVLWDGATAQTLTFGMGGNGAVLGAFVLGTDKLGTDQVVSTRKRMIGSGRRLSLLLSNSGNGQDFSIARALVGFTPGDERGT